jgi:hypothetical protein
MGMIIRNPDPSTTSVYLPIMTSIIGVWLPQPANQNSLATVIQKRSPASSDDPEMVEV